MQIPWHRYALLSYLAERLQGRPNVPDRTAVQKLIYFLQEARGVPCGYEYMFYDYGPYSQELASDLQYACALGVISVVPRPDLPAGFAVLPGGRAEEVRARAGEFLNRYRREIEEVVRDFGGHSVRELELLALIYYCHRFAADRGRLLSREGLVNQVKGLRPRLPETEIEAAADRLAQRGYLAERELLQKGF